VIAEIFPQEPDDPGVCPAAALSVGVRKDQVTPMDTTPHTDATPAPPQPLPAASDAPRAGQGWTVIDRIGVPQARQGAQPGKPDIRVLGRGDGVTVVALTFRAGDVMDDHRAASPILVIAESGVIDFGVDGQTLTLTPGQAINVAARVPHRLEATGDAVATLLVLTGGPATQTTPEPVSFVGRLPWVLPERA